MFGEFALFKAGNTMTSAAASGLVLPPFKKPTHFEPEEPALGDLFSCTYASANVEAEGRVVPPPDDCVGAASRLGRTPHGILVV